MQSFTMLAMQYDGARKLAGLWVDVVSEGRAVVLDDATIERPYGWVFFYQSRRFVETRDPLDQLVGNAPIIVNRFSFELRVTGTAHALDHYLAEYEATLPGGQMQARPPRSR